MTDVYPPFRLDMGPHEAVRDGERDSGPLPAPKLA
jgi:hypothetical protein